MNGMDGPFPNCDKERGVPRKVRVPRVSIHMAPGGDVRLCTDLRHVPRGCAACGARDVCCAAALQPQEVLGSAEDCVSREGKGVSIFSVLFLV